MKPNSFKENPPNSEDDSIEYEKEKGSNKLPETIYLILGDGKPIYYFLEVFLLRKINEHGISKELEKDVFSSIYHTYSIFPLPVFQIMDNKTMAENRSIEDPDVLSHLISFLNLQYDDKRGTKYFSKTLNLYEELFFRSTRNLFSIQPPLNPRLVIQELKYGKLNASFAYVALYRSPESYHTLVNLLDLLNHVYEKNRIHDAKLKIFIYSKESHLNYSILQDLVYVLNKHLNKGSIRISGIHYAVLHEEIDELRKLFIQNIGLLSNNFDVESYISMKVPMYDLISELYASMMRIYSHSVKTLTKFYPVID